MLKKLNNRQIAAFQLAILALVWGSSFILMKKGLFNEAGEQVLRGDHLGALRMVISGLVMLPFVIRSLSKYSWKKRGLLLLVGIVGNGLPSVLFGIAQTQINSSIAGILNATVPLFALMIGVWFFQLKTKASQWIGVALGFAGVGILVLVNHTGTVELNAFALLVLLATLCYGVSVNLIKTYLKDVPSLMITGGSFSLLVIPISIYLGATGFTESVSNPYFPKSLLFIGLLAVIGTSLAVWLFNDLVKRTNQVTAASVTYLIPIVAVFWGVIDGERFGLFHILGSAIVLIGVYLINKKKK